MDWKELFTNIKFRWLWGALLVVVPFEVLSIFFIHLSLWIELPLFSVILLIFSSGVFKSGFQSLLKLDFSTINFLMTTAVIGAVYFCSFGHINICFC